MAIVLVSLRGDSDVLIDKPVVVLGRSADCDVVLTSKKISRQHCCIAQIDDRLMIRDLGSTNGVKINGRTSQESYLSDGDEVSIGDMMYRVKIRGEAGPRKSPRDQDLEASDVPVPIEDSGVAGGAERAGMVDTPINVRLPKTPNPDVPPSPSGPPSDAGIILSPWEK